jgi:hypothetical protein
LPGIYQRMLREELGKAGPMEVGKLKSWQITSSADYLQLNFPLLIRDRTIASN